MTGFLGPLFWYIVTIGVLVTIHEFGHFWMARRFGVKVHRFSIGFGKALWSRTGRDGTEYVLAAIPLGGYVAMLDERVEEVAPEDLERAHNRKPAWQKIAIAVAGPAANLLAAVVAYWAMYVVGKPDFQPVIGPTTALAAEAGLRSGMRVTAIDGEPVTAWSEVSQGIIEAALYRRDVVLSVVVPEASSREIRLALSSVPKDTPDAELTRRIGVTYRLPARLGDVVAQGAGARAGLRVGDQVLSVDGLAVADFDAFAQALQSQSVDGEAVLVVMRDGERLRLVTRPEQTTEQGSTRYRLGVRPALQQDQILQYGPVAAIGHALHDVRKDALRSLKFLRDMLLGTLPTRHLSGPITIAQVADLSAQEGLPWFLGFLGAISLGLAILNLLPIPILDGGHVLYYLIELIKGSPVSERMLVAGQYVGLAMLSGLIGLAFFNDISGLFR